MIDVEGQLRIEISQGIVGQSGQMDHRVNAFEVGCLNVAKIFDDLRNHDRLGSKGAGAIQMRVQTDNFVACFQKHRYQNRPDVTAVSRNQNSHWKMPFASYFVISPFRPVWRISLYELQ